MRLKDRIGAAFDAFKNSGQRKSLDPAFWLDDSRKTEFESEREQLESYSGQIPWASVAVDRITSDMASQEFYFSDDRDGKIIDIRNVPDEVKQLFLNSWNGLSFIQRQKFIIPNRLLAGNAFYWKAKTTAFGKYSNNPDSLIPLNASQVKIQLKSNRLGIEQYNVDLGNGVQFSLAPDEIIHIKQNAIFSPFIGVGNITKMRLLAEGELAQAEYLNSFFADSSKLPMATIIESGARDVKDMERFHEKLKAKYSKRVMYLNGEGLSIQQFSLMQRDFQFIEFRQDTRQAILSIFGVPPVVAGIPDNSNRATSGNQFNGYYKSTINPGLREISDDFTQDIQLKYPDLRFNLKLYPTGDTEILTKQVKSGIITPNRAAELAGEEFDLTDESRNMFYFPSNLVPLATLTQQSHQSGKSLSDPRQVKEICEQFSKSATKPKQFQRRYLESALKSRLIIEDRNVGKISVFFEGQKKRVLNALRGFQAKSIKANINDLDATIIFQTEEEAALLRAELKGLHTSGVQKAITDINLITNRNVNLNLSNPFVSAAINELGQKITGTVNQTTLNDLQSLIANAINNNLTINELQDQIQGKFENWQGYRARMIARTEARAAWDAGANVSYREIGVQEIDIVGCTQFESYSDCGKQNIPIERMPFLVYHPNHIGVAAPSDEK